MGAAYSAGWGAIALMDAVLGVCLAVCGAWYLRYPRAVFDPVARVLVVLPPFGLHLWIRPRTGGTLLVDGERIIDSTLSHRTVLHHRYAHDDDWTNLARHLDAHAGPRELGAVVVRPAFLAPSHRAWGLIWIAVTLGAFAIVVGILFHATSATTASPTGAPAGGLAVSDVLPGAEAAPDRPRAHRADGAAGSPT
ncbi:hypothetical protein [Glycomyces sp. MUSA5-2]|uniref:hypothetical protein n=1 Tax=Glycomyces sp. MUSA5-2 TaxID=2053002 RepID=UPI00300B1D55